MKNSRGAEIRNKQYVTRYDWCQDVNAITLQLR